MHLQTQLRSLLRGALLGRELKRMRVTLEAQTALAQALVEELRVLVAVVAEVAQVPEEVVRRRLQTAQLGEGAGNDGQAGGGGEAPTVEVSFTDDAEQVEIEGIEARLTSATGQAPSEDEVLAELERVRSMPRG